MKKKDLYKLVKQSLKEVLQEQRKDRRRRDRRSRPGDLRRDRRFKPGDSFVDPRTGEVKILRPDDIDTELGIPKALVGAPTASPRLSRRDMIDALRKAGYTREKFEDLLKQTGLTPKTLSGLSASQFNQLLKDPNKFVDFVDDGDLPPLGGLSWVDHPTLDPAQASNGCAGVFDYSYPSQGSATGFFSQSDCGNSLTGTAVGDVVIGGVTNLEQMFPLSLMCCGEEASSGGTVGNAPLDMGEFFSSNNILGLEGGPGYYCYCPFPEYDNGYLTDCGINVLDINTIQFMLNQFDGNFTDDPTPINFADVTFPNSTSFDGLFNFSNEPPAGCGCMDEDADNYDPNATIENNDLCTYPSPTEILTACITPGADNYYCDDPESYGTGSPPCGDGTTDPEGTLPQDQATPPTSPSGEIIVVQDDPAGTVCEFPADTLTGCTDPDADNYYCVDNPPIPCTADGNNQLTILPTVDPTDGSPVIIQDTTPSMCQTTGCMIDPAGTNGNIVTVANYNDNATSPGMCEIAGCLDNTQNNYICNVLPDACVNGVPNTTDHNITDLLDACTFGGGCTDDGQQGADSPLASVDVGDVPAGISLANYINNQPNQTGAPATNYDADALFNDGSCEYNYNFGCIDGQTLLMPDGSVVNALNSDPNNNINWTSLTDDTNPCEFPGDGCMDDRAQNYNPTAINDDGSCLYTCYDITIQQCDIRMSPLPTKTINCAVFKDVAYPDNAIEVDDEILYEGIEIQQTQLIPPYPLEENVFNKKSMLEFLNLDEVEDIEKPGDPIPKDVYSTLECCDMYNNTVVMNPNGSYTYNGFLVPNAYSTEASFGQASGYQGSSTLTISSMGQFNNLDCSKFVSARGNQLFTNPPCSGEPVFTDVSTIAPDKNHRVITVTELTDQSSITNELEVGSCPNLTTGTGLSSLDKFGDKIGPTVQSVKESKKLRNAFRKYFLKK